ncbi:MAG TPA: hypothetical protein VHZ25_06160 [Acidobacteriaceae bacterium]|nr:hypothetical protein [Acidobacteriaceae bacterium]
MREDRIPLSHILPVVDLALLVRLVFVPITMTAMHLYAALKGSSQVEIHSGQFDMTLPRDQIVPAAIRMVTVSKAQTMMAINLPGVLLQALISLPSFKSGAEGWHPQALTLQTWQALVFPFFALPFWWLVGCGLDGLIGEERLHWSLLLAGTLLSATCLALTLGFRLGMSVSERIGSDWFIRGFAAWSIAFAVLPVAWIMQLSRQRGEHAGGSA